MVPQRGFTLLEVIISIFVVGVAATLAGTLLTVVPIARHTKFEDVALKATANEIEILRGLGYDSLPADGPINNELIAELPSGTGTISVVDYNENMKQVTATVSWKEASSTATSSVTLLTLITSIGGLK